MIDLWAPAKGTDPMAHGGLNKQMVAAAEMGGTRKYDHIFLNMEMRRLTRDGSDCRTRLVKLNSQARTTGTRKHSFSVFSCTSRNGNLTRLILTLAICDGYTYIQT